MILVIILRIGCLVKWLNLVVNVYVSQAVFRDCATLFEACLYFLYTG